MTEEAIAGDPLPVLDYEPMDGDDTCEPVARNAHRLQLATEAVTFQTRITPGQLAAADGYIFFQSVSYYTHRHHLFAFIPTTFLLGLLLLSYVLAYRYRGRPALFWISAGHGLVIFLFMFAIISQQSASIPFLIVLLVISLIVACFTVHAMVNRTWPTWQRIKYVIVQPEVQERVQNLIGLFKKNNRPGLGIVTFRDAKSERTIFPHNQSITRAGELLIRDRGLKFTPRYWFAPVAETAITRRRETNVSWRVAARLNWAGQQEDIVIDSNSLAIYDKLAQRDLPAEPL